MPEQLSTADDSMTIWSALKNCIGARLEVELMGRETSGGRQLPVVTTTIRSSVTVPSVTTLEASAEMLNRPLELLNVVNVGLCDQNG